MDEHDASVAPDEAPVLTARRAVLPAPAEQRDAARLLRALFEEALDGMVIADDAGRCVEANPAACRIFGVERERLLGRPVEEFCPPGHDLGRGGGEFQLRRPDGSLRDLEFQAAANFLPGRHLSVVRDVTERKRLEGQARQAQKLEALGQLAGSVAHDFNNLLTVITGYTEVLLGQLKAAGVAGPPQGEGEAAPMLREIRKAGERATRLTRELLAFAGGASQPGAHAPRGAGGRRAPLEVGAVVRGMEGTLRRLLGEGVELVTRLDPAAPVVLIDPGQLEQVLLNLIVNARDALAAAGAPAGRVVVSAGPAQLDGASAAARPGLAPGAYARLEVADTGCGMTEEVKAHLFEPFFTTKGRGKGAGLGLATAYGIVRASGGHLEAESEVGRGSTFRVYLPAAGPPPVPRRSSAHDLRLPPGGRPCCWSRTSPASATWPGSSSRAAATGCSWPPTASKGSGSPRASPAGSTCS
jgi:PAS domain S-box-containing protein